MKRPVEENFFKHTIFFPHCIVLSVNTEENYVPLAISSRFVLEYSIVRETCSKDERAQNHSLLVINLRRISVFFRGGG